DAAAIFGRVSLPLGTWDWHRPRRASAAAAMACAHRISTAGLPRRAIHRPIADECLATGWIRPCPYTPRFIPVGPPPAPPNAATIQWFRAASQNFFSAKISIDFRPLAPRQKRDSARGPQDLALRPTGKSGRDGGRSYACPTHEAD